MIRDYKKRTFELPHEKRNRQAVVALKKGAYLALFILTGVFLTLGFLGL